jgi:acylphosphatase
MTSVARHILITGHVQGVFFRQWTADAADRLGVAGWVRNRPDGSVEVHASGEAQAVEALIAELRHGPPMAEVAGFEIEEAEPTPDTGFWVRRDG